MPLSTCPYLIVTSWLKSYNYFALILIKWKDCVGLDAKNNNKGGKKRNQPSSRMKGNVIFQKRSRPSFIWPGVVDIKKSNEHGTKTFPESERNQASFSMNLLERDMMNQSNNNKPREKRWQRPITGWTPNTININVFILKGKKKSTRASNVL